MCRPTVSVAIVSSTLASSTLTPPTMACQVAKNRKAAGEMVVRLLAKTEKVLKDIKDGTKDGTLTIAEAQKAADAVHAVAMHDHEKVIGNNGAGE